MSRLYPCEPWPIDPTCCPGWPTAQPEWQPHHFRAQMLATIQLWRAVAGVIGLCQVTELPCLDRCTAGANTSQWMRPYRGADGGFYNDVCGRCTDSCSCRPMCTVTLQGPVWQIEEVRVDGQVVAPDGYRLLTGDRLASCQGCWPACQDYCTEDGLVVTYLRGVPPGPDAIAAVSMLACRRLAECPPGDDCGDLPDRTTSIQREGLSMQLSGSSIDEDGLHVTGIGPVDAWIASINPYGIGAPASVWSPDVPTPQVWRTGSVL